MSLESNKTLGGVGTILMFVGFLGVLGSAYVGFLVFVGAILVLIALKGFADHYQEGGIFNNALYGFITVIVGAVVTAAIFIMQVLQTLASIGIDLTNPIEVQQYFMNNINEALSLAAGAIAAWVVFFIFMIISAVLVRKSLNSLSEKSGEKIFGTAGLLWLIGAVLSIILIGFILIWVSWILAAVGFFSIKTAPAQATPTPVQPAPPPPPPPP